jgi:GNAT superfamily N-acetyltransferase
MTLHYLRDVPEHTETVAQWIFETFSYEFDTMTFDEWLTTMTQERITFVAAENGKALGTASLDFEDLPPKDDLTPWLASVYVLPEAREQGIGAQLVRAVEDEARSRGFKQLYLHTADRANFYAKRGWDVLTTIEYWNKINTVMVKRLHDSSS